MRPFFDREPRHDLDQTPQARRASGGETLKAAIAVALGLKLTRQVVQRRVPVAQRTWLAYTGTPCQRRFAFCGRLVDRQPANAV